MKEKNEELDLSYEAAMQELEEIRDALEEDLVSVDLLSEKVSRAYTLIEFCKKKLIKTEEELNAYTKDDKSE